MMTSPDNLRDPANNMRGALFMTLAMAGFAVEDMFLKSAAGALPVGQVLIMFGLFGGAVFALLSWRAGEPPLSRAMLAPVMMVRSACEVAGRLFYMLAIALTPVSTASAILQSAPLFVMAGAALFLGERVGRRRWMLVGVGFVGVLVILRPGTEGFGLLSLLALAGTLGFAGRDLATRAAPRVLSHRQLGVLGFAMLIVAGLIALPFGAQPVIPDAAALLRLVCASVAGVFAYYALTIAMRTGEVGAVTPFRYTRLVFAMVGGILVFAERPDLWTIAGSVIVVLAGIAALAPAAGRGG